MTGALPFQLDAETGLATIPVAGGRLVGVGWDVRLPRGGLGATARVLDVQSDAAGGVVRWTSDTALEGTWHLGGLEGGAVTARLVVTNRGPRAVGLASLEPLVVVPARGGVVALPGAPASWRSFDPGFQSWSPARTRPLGARWPAPRAAVVRTMSVHPWRADPRRAGWHVHDGAAGVYAGEAGFLVGVLQPRGLHAEIELDARGAVSLRARSVVEGLPLQPGETRESGEFVVLPGTPEATWARWASELGSAQGARTSTPAPVGWCSWYDYYTHVTEADLDANLRALAPLRQALGVTLFQVDDGYQADLGDWLTPRATFPSGMKAVAARIRDAGFTPGLWLAPFVARPTSALARANPDWFLTTARGRRRKAGYNPWWGGAFHALDLTHPGVEGWLTDTVGTLVHDWGFSFLKIDFVYAGLLDGRRHDPSLTTVETYRRGVQIVREAAGDEAHLLGCGAPLVHSVGLVDHLRIGPDVAEYWRRPIVDWLTGLDSSPGACQSLKNVLARQALHGRLWQNDPDCLLVRARNSRLSLDEVQTLASVVGLAGGLRMISDDLSRLEPARLELLHKVLPPPAWPARVGRVGAEPDLLVLTLPNQRRVVAWVNWGERPAEASLSAEALDLPAGRVAALDAWRGTTYEANLADGPLVTAPVPAHGVALLHVVPVGDAPRLVGGHVHVGLAELEAEAWDGAAGVLNLALRLPGERKGSYWVHLGAPTPGAPAVEGADARPVPGRAGWIRLDVHLVEHGRCTVRLPP